jgi:cytochrome o ubiquinol oxidase operon protein cyoD
MSHAHKKESALLAYVTGFVLSIALTLFAYYFVIAHVNSHHLSFSHKVVSLIISGFAVLQLYVQLFFFLHLGHEAKPRWNLLAFLFALLVVVILVFGSLWIMNNLDYNMSSQQTDTYIQNDENIQKPY